MLPPLMLSSSSIVHVYRQVQEIKGCSVLQMFKCSANVQMFCKCHPSSCLLVVLLCIQSIVCLFLPCVTSEMFHHFCNTTKTTQGHPQVFSVNGSIIWQFCCMVDIISSHITTFFQIWSTVVGNDESCMAFLGADLGRVQGVHPPPPEMNCGFLIQLVFYKKKKKTMWFIGVEVEQEKSAPPQKKIPGYAPGFSQSDTEKYFE